MYPLQFPFNSSPTEPKIYQTTLQAHGQKSGKLPKIALPLIYKLENIVVKGNIAQIEQYFFWQQCFF